MSLAAANLPEPDVVEVYAASQHLLGGSASYQQRRVGVARQFVRRNPDLEVWMAAALDARLAELERTLDLWPFIGFVILTGRCPADADLLFAKSFGHSMARWTAGLYAQDYERIRAAALRVSDAEDSARKLCAQALPMAVAFTGRPPAQLTCQDLDALAAAVTDSTRLTASMRRRWKSLVFGLRRVLFEAGITSSPAVRRHSGGPATRQARLGSVQAVEIRRTLLAYLDARAAVLRPKTIEKITSALAIFGEFLSAQFPELTSIADLERRHVEAFMAYTATRPGQGNHTDVEQVGPFTVAHAIISLRTFLDDITQWGWAQAPPRRLVFATDIPRQPDLLPRALPTDVDTALMAAIANLEDPFGRTGLTVMRRAGLRIGELLDLELDCIVDYHPAGSWLRVPLGKLNNERAVPLDEPTLKVLDDWFARRRQQRALPHPRDARPTDFVFVEHGRRLSPQRLRTQLRQAVANAGLTDVQGHPLHVVSHQLRHTYATTLANAGMSLPALMALLGHTSPEMSIRYARLASPTLRGAYDQAISKMRHLLPTVPPAPAPIPEHISWLNSQMLKTRVAHGYCTRDLPAQACTYANICETCPHFTTTGEFAPALRAQLDDIRQLRDDAEKRGWTSEIARHQRVIDSLEQHLQRLSHNP